MLYNSLHRKQKIEQHKLKYTIYFEIIINNTTVVHSFFFFYFQDYKFSFYEIQCGILQVRCNIKIPVILRVI
jgi:hypothetical protein